MNNLSSEQLNRIIETSETILSLQGIEKVFEKINDTACKLLNAERSTVFFYDDNRNELYSRITTKLEIKEIRIAMGQGIVGEVARYRKLVNIKDAYSDTRFNKDVDMNTGFITRSILAVPLVNREKELVGVFQVLNKLEGFFTSLDENIIKLFATYAVIALENSILYTQIQKAHQELVKLDNMKNKFINLSSHELLTPITILQGHISVIINELLFPLTEEQKEALTVVDEQVTKLTDLIRKIINVSELEYHIKELSYVDVSVKEFFQSINKELSSFAQNRHQKLNFAISDECSEYFQADPSKLRQALTNIIINAIKYTPDNGTIDVLVNQLNLQGKKDNEAFLKIEIIDSGIGIPKEEIDKIFLTFYEVKDILYHSTGTYEFNAGGLGLGLPISKKLVEAHKGWIEVTSEVEHGSTFTVFIPCKM